MMGGESAQSKTKIRFWQRIKDPEYRRKFIHSLILFLGYLFLGVRNAQHAPAFLDLAQITGTNIEQASIFYTADAVGALVGTFCMGFLFDKLIDHRLFLLAATCILGAVTNTAIPWSTNYPLTIFLFFINHFFSGGFDTGGNASMMSTWGVDGKMFMQFFHFCFSIGTIISPLIVQPFLSHLLSGNSTFCHPGHQQNSEPSQMYNSLNVTNVSHISESDNTTGSNMCILSDSRIHYAYLIAGVMCLISGIMLAVEGCLYNTKSKANVEPNEDHRNPRVLSRWINVIVITLIAVMFFSNCGAGIVIVGYIMAFCVGGLGWSKDKGTRLASVFWAGICAFRLLGVLIIKFLSPAKLMFISTSTVVLSLCGLWISVAQHSEWGVWVCILFSAAGFSVILPTGFIYIEKDVMKVTGKVTSVIWIAGNLQGVVNPPLLGYLMQEVSFKWYIYLALIEATLCLLSFGLLVLVVKLLISKADDTKVAVTMAEKEVKEAFIQDELPQENVSETQS